MKHAHIIESKLQGWYDDKIHKEIPTPNIKVDEEIWKEAISISANCYEDGKFIVKDFRTVEEIAQQELDKQIQEARCFLDSTQFKFGEDYDMKYTPEWEELKIKRQEAREFIRLNQ